MTSNVTDQVGAVVPGLLLSAILLGLFGLGFGTLVKNQVAAILLTIGGTLILESILIALARAIFHDDLNWLPNAAGAALAGDIARGFGGGGREGLRLLTWWQGGLVMLLWGLVPLPPSATSPRSAATSLSSCRRPVSRGTRPPGGPPGPAPQARRFSIPIGTPFTKVWVMPTGASAVRRSPWAGKSRTRRSGPGSTVSGSKTHRSAALPISTVPRSARP